MTENQIINRVKFMKKEIEIRARVKVAIIGSFVPADENLNTRQYLKFKMYVFHEFVQWDYEEEFDEFLFNHVTPERAAKEVCDRMENVFLGELFDAHPCEEKRSKERIKI